MQADSRDTRRATHADKVFGDDFFPFQVSSGRHGMVQVMTHVQDTSGTSLSA